MRLTALYKPPEPHPPSLNFLSKFSQLELIKHFHQNQIKPFMNSADYEPWMFQSTAAYADSWLTEAFARDAETLTRALQKTISNDTNTNNNSDAFVTSSDAVSSFFKAETHSASGVSGSDPEMAATVSRKRGLMKTTGTTKGGVVTKKITKRKPRATKKCQTTVIIADPANFRQMVQQVTGVRFETLQHQQSRNQLIVKPEPKRLSGNGLTLPTLDTSSFVIDHSLMSQHQQEQVGVGVLPACGSQREGWLTGCDNGVGQMAYGDSSFSGGAYQSFPTLESWN